MTEAVENNTNTEAVETPPVQTSIIGGDAEGAEPTEAKTVDETPIEYGEFTLPEGQELDQSLLDEFVPLFQKAKLPQEAAQELISKYAEAIPQIVEKAQAVAVEQVQSQIAERANQYLEDTKKDPEIGGAKLQESTALCGRAIDAYCDTPEEKQAFKAAMNEMGMGSHPAVVRFLTRIGKSVSEGTFHRGGATTAPRDAASILFGDSTNQRSK